MGRRGPAPTDRNVLQMRGTYRPDRDPGDEPEVAKLLELPAPPDHFGELAAKIWREKAELLVGLELLTEADLGSLEGYCLAHERAIEAEAIVRIEGRTVRTVQGLKRHPELITAEKARADMRRYEQEFGLTPNARARMRTPSAKPKEATKNPFGAVAQGASRKGA